MGISFKVSKKGTRYCSNPVHVTDNKGEDDDVVGEGIDNNPCRGIVTCSSSISSRKRAAEFREGEEYARIFHDLEVSFLLCLYPDGYSIGKASEGELGSQDIDEVPKVVRPYDRSSESLFSAIESGRIPGNILDDIPCKYINGMLNCEVRDYRKSFTDTGVNASLGSDSPIINKVCLRMTLQNVVDDITLISNNAWTYGDLMEVESRILKALQPKLYLDPTPKLDRLSGSPTPNKVKFSFPHTRRRSRQTAEVTTVASNNNSGIKVCIGRVPESCRLVESKDILPQYALENQQNENNGQHTMLVQKNIRVSNTSCPVPDSVLNPGDSLGQDMLSCSETIKSGAVSSHGKRDSQEAQYSALLNPSKRYRIVGNRNQQQNVTSQVKGSSGSETQWKSMLGQQPSLARGLQNGNSGMQKCHQQRLEDALKQEAGSMNLSMKHSLKEVSVDLEGLEKMQLGGSRNNIHPMESEVNHVNFQHSCLPSIHRQFPRSSFPQAHWNSMGMPLESNSRKENSYQRTKVVHSPRVSSGGLPQSPLSSKSGEFSSGSVGPQVGPAASSGFLSLQKKRSAVTPVPHSANDSMQRQYQTQIASERKSGSLPKTAAMSGVGSHISVSNTGISLHVSSPPVGNPLLDELVMIERTIDRFFIINMLTVRYQLNGKKNKVVQQPFSKSKVFPSQDFLHHLSTDSRKENSKDDSSTMPLSRSLIGGSMNVCKARYLKFMPAERIIQGNSFSVPIAHTRLIMTEKPNDGSVAMHIGEIENVQYFAAEDYFPTLPNTHYADLLAAQFCSLMIREGYQVEDHVEAKPMAMPSPSSSEPITLGVPLNNGKAEIQESSEIISFQPAAGNIIKPSNSTSVPSNQSHNIQDTGMLPSGNAQGLHNSEERMLQSHSQHSDLLSSLMQQQQSQQPLLEGQEPIMQLQNPQIQRSRMMFAASPEPQRFNALGQSPNVQLVGHMASNLSPRQLQLFHLQQQKTWFLQPQPVPQKKQKQWQQQQEQQMLREMMMNSETVGMRSFGNNMVGLGALDNVMGLRRVGVSGISTPMVSTGGMGNMSQNSMMNLGQASSVGNIAQQLHLGQLTPPEYAALIETKLKMTRSRGNMLGGPQTVIGAMTGARQMHAGTTGVSVFGTASNQGNINPMQRAVGQMGPPRLMEGLNAYMNLHQQQQQLLLHQQLQQQQSQQQNESTSPLQSIVLSPLGGSPSNMLVSQPINQQTQQKLQQQHASPQKMRQRIRTSLQPSSGASRTISAGNPEMWPASPQMSSQTLGSDTNSPMELSFYEEICKMPENLIFD